MLSQSRGSVGRLSESSSQQDIFNNIDIILNQQIETLECFNEDGSRKSDEIGRKLMKIKMIH